MTRRHGATRCPGCADARGCAGRVVGRSERGSVTAEMAIGLPAVVLLLVLVLAVGAVAGAQLRVLEAARAGARESLHGSSDAQVAEVARTVAGDGAQVHVVRDPPWVRVTVAAPGVGGPLAGVVVVRATAQGYLEP